MSRKPSATELRVGIFLAIGLGLAAMAIVTVGEKSGLFDAKTKVHVYFDDISGLVEGAAVRLAGLDVGTVSLIEFPVQVHRRQARVTLSIKTRYMERVRRDSVALIDSKGLLGDKIINITLGTAQSPQLREGEVLKSRRAPSFEDLAAKLDKAVSAVTDMTSGLSKGAAGSDLGRLLASTANILQQVERGPGFAHRFFYDPKYGQQVEHILDETSALVTQARSGVARLDRTLAEVEHGDGMAHEVIYGETGKLLIAELRQATADIDAILSEVREGDGTLHALIFEDQGKRALDELNEAAAGINHIVTQINRGRGTLGGLVTDPSVYEDLKTVLGNINRNVLLKALIRFTIKEGDIERPATLPVRPVKSGE